MLIRTVVCDVGDVLIDFDYSRCFAYLAHVLHTDAHTVRTLWTDRASPDALLYHFARGDIDLAGLWEGFERKFGIRFHADMEHDFRLLWMVGSEGLNTKVHHLLESLHTTHGIRLISCTNVDPIHGQELRGPGEALHNFFAAEVQSWQVGAMKPETLMYERALEVAAAAPEECLFIDDTLENVKAAQRFGMHGHHFTNAAALAHALEQLGLPLK